MNEHLLDDGDAVCVVRLPGDGAPEQGEFEEAGYRILKSIAPAVKDRVLIKPNVLPETEYGLMTHPAFVGGMVDYLTEVGVRAGLRGKGCDRSGALHGASQCLILPNLASYRLIFLTSH